MKKEILEKIKRKSKILEYPWGTVEIRELSGEDYMEITEKTLYGQKVNYKEFLNLALQRSVYLDGELLFESTEEVVQLPASVYGELLTEMTQLNGLDDQKKGLKTL